MLTLVTVCFNNPEELEKTVASVSLQSEELDDYVIVDSSDGDVVSRMKHIADTANARYVWVPPQGVYKAMRHSLSLVEEESFVWWVNSSDWLAGRRSVEIVKNALSDASSRPDIHWVVGELLRVHHPTPSSHPIGSSGEEFLRMLRTGKTGFPHPSTVFRKASLDAVTPYEDSFSIASDYATALRFGKRFGPPLLVPQTLSVHDPNGLTSRHPVKNLWERSQARIRTSSPVDAVAETWRLPLSSIRGASNRFRGEKPVEASPERSEHFPLRGNEPFDLKPHHDPGLNFDPSHPA